MIKFLGLSLEEPFGDLEDDNELVLLEELVEVLEGELLELEGLEESSYLGFQCFLSFWIQDKFLPPASSGYCLHPELQGARPLEW